jgi:hypothetical protein
MNAANLMAELVLIERVEGHENPQIVRAMLREAQDSVLELQKDMLTILREVEELRRCADNSRRSSLFRLSKPRLSDQVQTAMELSRPVQENRLRRRIPLFTLQ